MYALTCLIDGNVATQDAKLAIAENIGKIELTLNFDEGFRYPRDFGRCDVLD